jgi:predicted  nucleic acid-binding Zn-ribbon protein
MPTVTDRVKSIAQHVLSPKKSPKTPSTPVSNSSPFKSQTIEELKKLRNENSQLRDSVKYLNDQLLEMSLENEILCNEVQQLETTIHQQQSDVYAIVKESTEPVDMSKITIRAKDQLTKLYNEKYNRLVKRYENLRIRLKRYQEKEWKHQTNISVVPSKRKVIWDQLKKNGVFLEPEKQVVAPSTKLRGFKYENDKRVSVTVIVDKDGECKFV